MSSEVIIKAENLSKCYHIYDNPRDRLMQMLMRSRRQLYREFWALKDVTFEVKRGQTIGIVGRNGSGKSTALQILCGTLNPTQGHINVVGRIAALLELGAGFNPEFTGKENVFMNASILGLSYEEINDCYDKIVEFADIGDFIDQPVKMYSSGMYVRLAFAVVINVSPDVLIIDEALAVGDARFQAKCYRKIKQLKERGVTILFVSHDVGSVKTLCDYAIWLEKGSILSKGDVQKVTSDYVRFLFQNENLDAEVSSPEIDKPRSDGTKYDGPINHWGSNIGSIVEAGIYDAEGEKLHIISNDEKVSVKIRFHMPLNVKASSFSVGFAFRTLSGTDILVSSSCEYDMLFDPEAGGKGLYEVRFSLNNPLNAGKYMLVAILEDRDGSTPEYYEFIEGVQYFTVIFDKQRYGSVCLNKFIEVSSDRLEEVKK